MSPLLSMTGHIRVRRSLTSHSASVMRSPLVRQEVNDPAATDVRPRLATMFKNIPVETARFLQGIGHNGHGVEPLAVVDPTGQFQHSAVVPNQPGPSQGDAAERERPEDATEH